jgi:glycosyltransferase involved in cell wall biosynthesis
LKNAGAVTPSNPNPAGGSRDALGAIVVLIPAYQPGEELAQSLAALQAAGVRHMVVVNDGSTEGAEVFEQARRIPGCEVIEHSVNLGKGRALKTGFNHIYLRHRDCARVVTADADGQHTVRDIVRVAAASLRDGAGIMMGARTFSKDAPARSRFGNAISRHVLHLAAGLKLTDTQSGLRAVPMSLLPHLIRLEGEQYEYEMNMLLSAREARWPVLETPISTVYVENNRSSHFSPLLDSMKIYFVLLRFAGTSLCTSCLDQLLFFAAWKGGLSVAAAMVAGRLGSSVFNLAVNRGFVFKSSAGLAGILLRYYSVMAFAGVVAYGLISSLTRAFGWPVPVAKIVVESGLFFVSFLVNREFTFASPAGPGKQRG